MAAVRAPEVTRAASFDADVAVLAEQFSEVEEVVEDFIEFLSVAWNPPHVSVDADKMASVYVTQLDYPPFGSGGLGKFIVVYHASPPAENPMQQPLRTYTLLTLVLAH